MGVAVSVECRGMVVPAHAMVHPHGRQGHRASAAFWLSRLVRDGRSGLTVEARAKFVKSCEGVDTVLGCLQKVLHRELGEFRRGLQTQVGGRRES